MPQISNQCVFCSSPDIAKRTIVRDDLIWVFPSNTPIVPGHVLVCPVRHVEKFENLTTGEMEALWSMLKQVKKALHSAFKPGGFNYAWNEGAVGGQSVPHFHLHVLPRRAGDTGVIQYEPRNFLYRPGSREPTPETELASIAREIKRFM